MNQNSEAKFGLQVWHFVAIVRNACLPVMHRSWLLSITRSPFCVVPNWTVLSGLIIAFCMYIVAKPYFESGKKEKPVEKEEKMEKEEKAMRTEEKDESSTVPAMPKRIVYSVEFIRNLRTPLEGKHPYNIVTKVESYGRHSPTPFAVSRGKSPDPFNYFRNHTPDVDECVTRSSRGRLNAEEERDYEQSMRELTPDFCHLPAESLPKDVQMGRVHWLRKATGASTWCSRSTASATSSSTSTTASWRRAIRSSWATP